MTRRRFLLLRPLPRPGWFSIRPVTRPRPTDPMADSLVPPDPRRTLTEGLKVPVGP